MPRVLVIRGGAIGDFILTIPAIRLLREGLPVRPHLEVLGYKPVTALAEAAGLADATRSIEHAALANFFVPGAKLDPGWMNYIRSFDVVVSYLFDPDGYFAANVKATGVETLLTWSGKVDPSAGTHAARQLATPLEELALFLDDPAPTLTIPPPDNLTPPVPQASPLVAVHPGSGSPSKNWGYENWTTACEAVHATHPGAAFLLVTGEAEHDTRDDLLALFTAAGIPFTPLHGLPLTSLAAHLARADAFLGHDSGIGHLAAALGLPSLLLFGPTDPAVWAPQNPGAEVLQAPSGNLAAIPPEDVATRAGELLEA